MGKQVKTLSGCPPTDGPGKLQANPDTDLTLARPMCQIN